jgi:G3E family GTPase
MVAVDILTGYLGAGKTTLLRHALDHGLDGRRVAIVVNELGEIGVDGTLLAGPGGVESMVELTNGCICCTIDAARFDRALVDLVDRTGAELVVIETTGVADPAPLTDRLRRLGFGIDAVTAVVDAGSIEEQLAREGVVARQIAAADFVVIGKTDLVPARALARVERLVAELNPRASRSSAERGRVDPALLFATGVRRWRAAPAARGSAGASRVEAFVFRTPDPLDLARFEDVLGALPPAVVRAKGVLRVAGAGAHCVFNYASGRHELSWMRLPGVSESQAVFIGHDVRAHELAVQAALGACIRREPHVHAGA